MPLFQNEFKCETFLHENEFCMQFHFHADQSHFHKNGFALRLALKQRHKGTRKWSISAHCYCVSLVRTLYMTWRVPRHVFQARTPSRNSTKYRADDLCGNLFCEYFCWMLGDPHFFFGRSLPDSFHYKKKKKKSVRGKF